MFFEKFKRPEFLSKPSRSNVLFAAAFGSVMWFWILFRSSQDGPYLLVSKKRIEMILILPSRDSSLILITKTKMIITNKQFI